MSTASDEVFSGLLGEPIPGEEGEGPPGPETRKPPTAIGGFLGDADKTKLNSNTLAPAKTGSNPAADVLAPVLARVNRRFCWIKTADGPRRIDERLDHLKIARHIAGSEAYGACPIQPGESTTRLALLDFDSHGGETPWEQMMAVVCQVRDALELQGYEPVLFRSSGGRGVHVLLLWDQPQDAYSVREMLREALAACSLRPGTAGVKAGTVEVYPKQDSVAPDKFGSMFVLPLAGKSVPLDRAGNPLPRSAPIKWPLSDNVPQREKPERPQAAPVSADIALLRQALATIPNGEANSLDYDEWFRVVAAIHHATDGSDEGLLLAQEFSARSPKYDSDFLESRVWPYLNQDRDNAITARTVFAKAREHGWEEPVEDDFEVLPPEPATAADKGLCRFEVIPAADFAAGARPGWIVKGVIPVAEMGVIYGASGSGKSFLALDLFAAVARGTPWRGHRVKQGRVVYVAAEGAGGFRKRLKAFTQHHDTPLAEVPLGVIGDAPDLLRTDDTKALLASLQNYGRVDVVVVDTFARATPGADENSAEDIGKALKHCQVIHHATGALVVLIHHAGKDPTKGARGWSGLKAAADFEIEVSRNESERWARLTKSKDGEDGLMFAFRLAVVSLGQDEDDDEITSCVVEHVNELAEKRREPGGKWQKRVWRAAHEVADLGGEAANVEAVVARAVEGTTHDPSLKRDTRCQSAHRAINELIEAGYLSLDGERLRVVA